MATSGSALSGIQQRCGLPTGRPCAGSTPPAFSDWPFESSLELGALPGAVPCSRLHTREVLWEWGLDAIGDQVELVVSELVTNGLHASEDLAAGREAGQRAPGILPMHLWLHADGQRVVIEVWDSNEGVPSRRMPGADAESGRGLLLVEAVSESWGCWLSPDFPGKVVWAVVCRA